jgi:hypothetical protein
MKTAALSQPQIQFSQKKKFAKIVFRTPNLNNIIPVIESMAVIHYNFKELSCGLEWKDF